MDIDRCDLVILARSRDANAKRTHDGNLITFDRVKNFRDLVYGVAMRAAVGFLSPVL